MLGLRFTRGRHSTVERELTSASTAQGDARTPPDGTTSTPSVTWLTLAKPGGSSSAMLAAIFPGVPMTAVVVTVLSFETGWPTSVLKASPEVTSVLVGSVVAVVGWVLAAVVFRRFAGPDLSNVDEYGQLVARLQQVKEQLTLAILHGSPAAAVALQQAKDLCAIVEHDLQRAGLRWVLAIGYVNSWIAIHRAEEGLFLVDPAEAVISRALYDQLRLEGSDVAHADELLNAIRHAVKVLDPKAEALYLRTSEMLGAPTDADFAGASVQTARAVLAKVRRSINEYRDLLWAGLTRVRNQLVATVFVTGIGTYLLLALLLVRGLDRPTIGAAAIFFTFGALVGLLARLRGESQADKAVEDFGLSITRLIAAPLLSGLTAVFGVLIVGLAHISIGNVTLGPPIPAGSSLPRLRDIFSLVLNPTGFVAASLFGLTPSLLFDYLQSETETFRKGLKTSEASGQSPSRR